MINVQRSPSPQSTAAVVVKLLLAILIAFRNMIKAAREKHPPVYSLSVDGVIDAYLGKRLSIYLSTMYARNLYRKPKSSVFTCGTKGLANKR